MMLRYPSLPYLIQCPLLTLLACADDPSTAIDDPSPPTGKSDSAAEAQELSEGRFLNSLSEEERAEIVSLRLDVNDVSYLWPVTSFFDFEKLIPIAPQEGPQLIPSTQMYNAARDFLDIDSRPEVMNPVTGLPESTPAPSDTISAVSPDFLRVVAFRFDDCAPGTRSGDRAMVDLIRWEAQMSETGERTIAKDDPSLETFPCAPQLRLVVQGDSSVDMGVHLIYTYVRAPESFARDLAERRDWEPLEEVSQAIIGDLQFLKSRSPSSTSGRALGVHPGLDASGLDGEFTGLVEDFLRFYARPEFLTNIAFLSTNNFDGGADWVMTSATIDHDSPDELRLTPQLMRRGSPLALAFRLGSNDSLDLEFDDPIGSAIAIRDALENTTADDFVAVSNPHLTQVPATDCASCHRETHSYLHMIRDGRLEELEQIVSDEAFYRPAPGVTGFVDPQAVQFFDLDGLPSFHNFGHMFNRPTVAVRTAHESAEVASSINERLFGDPEGPGLRCTEDARRQLFMDIIRGKELSDSNPDLPPSTFEDLVMDGCEMAK